MFEALLSIKKLPLMTSLSWLLIMVGNILCIVGIVWMVGIAGIYPPASRLFAAALSLELSFILMAYWMPGSSFLIYQEVKKVWIAGIFVSGCLMAIILSSFAIIILEPYTERNFTRNEYLELTKAAVDANQEKVPAWVGHVKDYNCCSWYGSFDFGSEYMIADRNAVRDALKADCFFADLKPGPDGRIRVPEGCAVIIKTKVKKFCEDIYIVSFIVIVVGVLAIFVYAYHFLKLRTTPIPESHPRRQTIILNYAQPDEDLGYVPYPGVPGTNQQFFVENTPDQFPKIHNSAQKEPLNRSSDSPADQSGQNPWPKNEDQKKSTKTSQPLTRTSGNKPGATDQTDTSTSQPRNRSSGGSRKVRFGGENISPVKSSSDQAVLELSPEGRR